MKGVHIMRSEITTINGKTVYRVSKAQARQYFKLGATLYLYPVNFNPDSMWAEPYELNKKTMKYESFDDTVSAFEYYCCYGQVGTYAKFFTEGMISAYRK